MHHHRQRTMAPHQRNTHICKEKQHQNDTLTTIQSRTQPNRTILEKHQTKTCNKNILQQRTTHCRT